MPPCEKLNMWVAGVSKCCLIQTSTFYRFDNRYICESAKVSSDWAAGESAAASGPPHRPSGTGWRHRRGGMLGRVYAALSSWLYTQPGTEGLRAPRSSLLVDPAPAVRAEAG